MEWIVQCDLCGRRGSVERETEQDARAVANDAGWKCRTYGPEWCPQCWKELQERIAIQNVLKK